MIEIRVIVDDTKDPDTCTEYQEENVKFKEAAQALYKLEKIKHHLLEFEWDGLFRTKTEED